ncbi:MAG TPA: YbaN family protein [Acidimicrobiia bacterium]
MFMTLGFLFLLAGIAGYIVPGLPGTPLLLVAAWLFSTSNDRLYRWMTTNRWFGQTVADYRAGLGISRKAKFVAIGSIAVVVPSSVMFGTTSWLIRLAMIALALIGVGFILTRPTRDLIAENA